MNIVLASASKYRRQQLELLGIGFTAVPAEINEAPLPDEPVVQLPQRLAKQKALKIFSQYSTACVIGSDQICTFNQQVFGKPGTREQAIRHLQLFSGNRIEFLTALCLLIPDGRQLQHVDHTLVEFRSLSLSEIEHYVDREQPLDCAGAFKVESLGLSLFTAVQSTDPSALMGLPLIKLCDFLRQAGIKVP